MYSRRPGFLAVLSCFVREFPPRTSGPLGLNDGADPNVRSGIGDTPGTLGVNDQAMLTTGANAAGISFLPKVTAADVAAGDIKQHLKASEGSVSHLYLDTVGKVTIGVGNMLPSSTEAQKLAFVNRVTRQPATNEEIKTDFDNVKKQTSGMVASKYLEHTKLDLPDTEIDSLLDARIIEFKNGLKTKFSNFEDYPGTVQNALLDMAFNLGITGLVAKFPSLKAAILAEDWQKAADESNRPQVSKVRNTAVKDWLEAAAKAQAP